ncbi:MAG: RDD family protein [Arachnia sp.]
MTNTPQPPAGWYPDPAGSDGERFWDGVAWSQATRDKPAPPPPAEPLAPPSPQPAGYGQPMGQQGGYQHPDPTSPPAPYGGYHPAQRPSGPRIAAFGWRLLCFLIDAILISVVGGIVAGPLGITDKMSHALEGWFRDLAIWSETAAGDPPGIPNDLSVANSELTVLLLVLFIIYRTLMLGTVSATLGQLAVGLRTVKVGAAPDSRIGWGTAVLRGIVGAFTYTIAFVTFVSGVCMLVNRNRQSLQDLVARTHVIKVR